MSINMKSSRFADICLKSLLISMVLMGSLSATMCKMQYPIPIPVIHHRFRSEILKSMDGSLKSDLVCPGAAFLISESPTGRMSAGGGGDSEIISPKVLCQSNII